MSKYKNPRPPMPSVEAPGQGPSVVDHFVVIDEVDYKVRPGTVYAFAKGHTAALKMPYEGVIELYNSWELPEEGATAEDVAHINAKKASAVLDTDFDFDEQFGLLDRVVVDRVVNDFFFCAQPRLSKHMQSLMEAVKEAKSKQANESSQS